MIDSTERDRVSLWSGSRRSRVAEQVQLQTFFSQYGLKCRKEGESYVVLDRDRKGVFFMGATINFLKE